MQQWGQRGGGGGGFRLDNRGLVQVRLAVRAPRRVAAARGGHRRAVPQLALALPQLGDVALEAQAELGVLSPGGFRRSLLQVNPLHVHRFRNVLGSSVGAGGGGRFGVGGRAGSFLCAP